MNCNCNCEAYDFPHRPGGGACFTPDLIDTVGPSGFDIDLETAAEWAAGFDCPVLASREFLACNG
jgi:hypothetical protein